MANKTIAIVGAGASGLLCAITAKRRLHEAGKNAQVIVYERNPRAGKKLLATGNGRCNLTNMEQPLSAYHTDDIGTAAAVLGAFPVEDILQFFEDIGLTCVQNGSLVYPRSMQAASVLDVLRFEAERLGVLFACGQEISAIRPESGVFRLSASSGEVCRANAVIIASGSEASGGSAGGLSLLKSLGHKITPSYPALTPLRCDTTHIKTAAGMRANALLRLEIDGKAVHSEEGEGLFTDYGLSGIAVMQLSGAVSRLYASGKKHDVQIVLDLAPEYDFSQVYALLLRRRDILRGQPLEQLLCGFLNKRVAMAACKAADIGALSIPIETCTDRQLKTLAALLKAWRIPVIGVKGAPSAQVMGGGAALNEFDAHTLASKKTKGVFACGEVLDIYGDCGGYNLTWAWASGFVAGRGAADSV